MFEVNGPEPPLPYADDSFDLVYALSVLTHLPVETQRRWLEELARVAREWVLVSIHGEPYRVRLTEEELRRFDGGEIVVRWGEVAGTNLCTAFHPRSAFEKLVEPRFELVSYVPEGAKGNRPQDLALLAGQVSGPREASRARAPGATPGHHPLSILLRRIARVCDRSEPKVRRGQSPSRSSIRSSRRHFGRTLTTSSRNTGCPSSASISGRARVPISRTIAPPLPTRICFCESVST